MSVDWSTNGQYEFGLFVPVFIAFLLFLRWRDLPVPDGNSSALSGLVVGLAAILALIPIRLIEEANPEWRPLNWVHAVILIALTLAPVHVAGGWKWVRHFLPPLALLFMALPWPLAIEQGVIQYLARAVSSVTTEILNWTGIPAIQSGNVIEVPTGPVGVQDACTGIRSLAGSLMSAVFFGEYYRFRAWQRLTLVIGGVVAALFLNLVRTYFLCWIAATRGVGAVSSWHDQAGLIIFCASFGALWMMAEFLDDGELTPGRKPGTNLPLRTVSMTAAIIGLTGIVLTEVGSFAWYSAHEHGQGRAVSWAPSLPGPETGTKYLEVADEARAILRYSEGYSAEVPFNDGGRWQIFFFRWAAGRSSSQLAVLHRPEICMPAAGFKMVGSTKPLDVQVNGLVLPFQSTIFETNGRRIYVFRTLWEERPDSGDVLARGFDQSVRGRLSSVWHGRRNLGQQLLQVGISGASSEEAAREDLIRRLPGLIAVTH
jgi:exosortase